MAKFLAYGGRIVAHDVAAQIDTVDDFLTHLGPAGLAGMVETGAVLAWELVARAWPDTRFVVVRRDPNEVAASLAREGLALADADLRARLDAMDRLAHRPGTLVLGYNALSNPIACAGLFEHCLNTPFDWQWWRSLADENVQIDMTTRVALLASRAEAAKALRAEATERIRNPRPFTWIGWQPWREVDREIAALGAAHYREADDNSRSYRLDLHELGKLADAGVLFTVCARVDAEMVGYCTWSKEPDTEATGHVILNQGAWYCRPDQRLGLQMMKWSIEQFRRSGIKHLRLHHTMSGRGARLGPLFKRMGAIECKREYDLRLDTM